MNEFITKLGDQVKGFLSGFDRLVFRGTIRSLCHPQGVEIYMRKHRILHKDFGDHAEALSKRLTQSSLAAFHAAGRKERYITSPQLSKEEIARAVMREEQIEHGTICILTAVEPCLSFEMYRNAQSKQLDLQSRMRKCKHIYHYLIHPVFGFMNVRIQTWFPFRVQVCINGREWLGKQMSDARLAYTRADNCFPWVESFPAAQSLLNAQLQADYSALLDAVLLEVHPLHAELRSAFGSDYYWSCYQSEWATDLVFSDRSYLERLYPRLIQHGVTTFSSPNVLRFLGKPLNCASGIYKNFHGEATTDLKTRSEGVRIKHYVNGNSVKMYDKAKTPQGSVLRIETTVGHPEEFFVLRAKEGGPADQKERRYLRKGVVDLPARADVSQSCNDRYMTAMASVDNEQRLKELIEAVMMPASLSQKRVRAMRPFDSEDSKLLSLISRGEFVLHGIRNRDLQAVWFGDHAKDKEEARKRSGFITRKLRLLRAHNIVEKIAGTNRYQLTTEGRRLITAVLAARETPVKQLLPIAA
jgi:hypothetical protein